MKLLTTAILFMSLAVLFLSGCAAHEKSAYEESSSAVDLGPPFAGNGAAYLGKGALSVPTTDAIVVRLENGLGVSSRAGNFSRALAQVKGNLPKVTDPTKASGYDQVQLLAYAACSDLTTGTPKKMQSAYQVNSTATINASKAALIAAGVKMMDQYTAGLASGSAKEGVTTTFTDLITKLSSGSGNTTTIAFMSVCVAASTTGVTMLGF